VPIVALLAGCTGIMPRLGRPRPEEGRGDARSVEAASDAGAEDGGVPDDLEDEEAIHEDPDALDGLLSRLMAGAEGDRPVGGTAGAGRPEGPEAGAVGDQVGEAGASGIEVPRAHDNWARTDEQCFATLDAAGVRYTRPDFDTPFVAAPLLLDGPIEGVEIRPRWKRPHPENSVMDCRLALALVEVARVAKAAGVTEILFYSTYRPIRPPDGPCAPGKAGRKCRAARDAYDKAKRGHASRHRTALAIDIRWMVTADGETVDVLEDYERKSGSPPCEDDPQTEKGRLLKEFACTLHERRIFNVILTPNSNKDHHNHFHMDITPKATWYIIR